jgi:N-acetyl-D-muramate 6-phosphate phosphatase
VQVINHHTTVPHFINELTHVTSQRIIRAVLFDLDGTLIDSAPDLAAAADKMRIDRGLPSLAYEKYRPMAGAGARGMLGVAFDMTPEHPNFVAWREEFFYNYEMCLTQRTRAFVGIEELLATLWMRGLVWGIVTNKSKRFTDALVRQMPVLSDAAVVISGDTTAHAKPHPEPMFEASRRLKTAPEYCVYIGDDKRDIEAGQAAGMPSLAATWGYMGSHDVTSWNADAALKEPDCVLDWLDGHL